VQWTLLQTDEEKWLDTIKKQADSEYSDFNKTAFSRCYPMFAKELLADDSTSIKNWMAEFDWIWALPQVCQRGGDQ
jgi:exodeoxyribonuclease V gamma subunit